MKTRCRKVGCENALFRLEHHSDFDDDDYNRDDVMIIIIIMFIIMIMIFMIIIIMALVRFKQRADNLTVLQGRAAVMKLLWGCDDDIARVVEERRQQQQQQQQRASPRALFDLIVGSDLLYNPDAYTG